MGDLNKQVSSLTDEKRQMEARVATLEQENAVQHAQPDAGATSGPRIEELQKLNVGGFFLLAYEAIRQLAFRNPCRQSATNCS